MGVVTAFLMFVRQAPVYEMWVSSWISDGVEAQEELVRAAATPAGLQQYILTKGSTR